MAFRTYFLANSFAFVASGLLALLLTGRLDLVSPALYAGALAGAWYVERRRPDLLMSRRKAVVLSALTLPLCAADVLLLGNPFLALARFAFLLSAIKLFQVKNDSDWVWLYALAFCQVLLAASLTIDATFLLSLGVFLFFAVSTLGAFEIVRARRSLEPAGEETGATREGAARPLRRSLHLGWVSGLQLALVALLSVPFFLLMPRFGGGGVGGALAQGDALSGFSDTVRLGELEPIKLNPAVVMHVRVENARGRTLRWRGVALELFDGRTWKTADRPDRALAQNPAIGPRAVWVPRADAALRPSQLVAQTVYLEPISTRTLFAASRVVAVDDPPPQLRVDGADVMVANRRPGGRASYTAFSDVEPPAEETLLADASADYPEDVLEFDLQLPRETDPRVAELARRVAGDAATPYEKARRLEAFLRTFSYSLRPVRVDRSLDPVSDFVLNARSGHCELFASAMVVMLRGIGVPARVVNGFQMGEFNSLTETYTVRQLDAHSWVEVYFAGPDRWVEFDPTPAAGLNSYEIDLAARVRQSIEALQLVWARYVVSLGTSEQVSLFRRAQQGLRTVRDRMRDAARAWRLELAEAIERARRAGALTPRGMLLGVTALTLVGVLSFAAMVLRGRGWSVAGFVVPVWRLRWLSRRTGSRERAAVGFYEQMLAMLARHGIERERHETPLEFARACGIAEVRAITEHYHRVRFGGDADSRLEREVAAALARLAAELRRRKR